MFLKSLNGEKNMTRKMERFAGFATVYVYQKDFAKAEELYKNAIELGPRILAGKSCRWLSAMNGMAVLRTQKREFNEAEHLFQQVLEGRKEKLGDCHPKTLETIKDFGVLSR